MSRYLNYTIGAIISAISIIGAPERVNALGFQRHPDADSRTLNAILATGEIRAGDTEGLIEYLISLPEKIHTAIYLDSPGGDLYEGMKLGRLFRKARIKTVIEGGGICASACALAFLGGRDKDGNPWMSSTTTSKLGFHAFQNADGTLTDNTDNVQRIVSDVLDYGRDVNAPIDIFIANFGTSSSDMYWFRRHELMGLGIKVWDIMNDCFLPCK